MLERARAWARIIKRDAHTLYLCARDPRVPWHVKALAAFVAAYVLSPIDLIPDFIPVLGLIDDLLLAPLGIWIVVKLVPKEIVSAHRATAEAAQDRPVSRVAAVVIVGVWIFSALGVAWLLLRG